MTLSRRSFLVFFVAALATASAQEFALKDGDRVVFYGDSITDQRLYTTFAETFAVTRFPERNITFVHSGWGGDRVSGGGGGLADVRLQRDVIAYKPTVVTIMLGMNDGSYRAFDEAIFKEYTTGFEKIVSTLKGALPNVRLTLIQPSPYDDVTRPPNFEGGYNAVLVRYGAYLKELSEREHTGLADLNTSVVAALKRADATDHAGALKIVPDRVHPGPGGHLLMAAALLKAWNAPSVVSDVTLDASSKEAATSNANVSDVSAEGGGLRWSQTDNALPMPVNMKDPVTTLAVRSSDFVESLNREMLKVRGLAAGSYTLKIDGGAVGNYTADELAKGINLAMLDTPMSRQAAKVHDLTLKRAGIHNVRWRSLQVPLADDAPEHLKAAMDLLDLLDADLMKMQRAAAQPKAHAFELTAAQ